MFISVKALKSWKDLELAVEFFMKELGYTTKRGSSVALVNGGVAAVDVVATLESPPPAYQILIECKHWKRNVERSIVQALKMDVQESGSNFGIIVSSKGHQPGAFTGALLSTVRLYNFEEFQSHYAPLWVAKNLNPLWDRYKDAMADARVLDEQSGQGQHFRNMLKGHKLERVAGRLERMTSSVNGAFLSGMAFFSNGTERMTRPIKVTLWSITRPSSGWVYTYRDARQFMHAMNDMFDLVEKSWRDLHTRLAHDKLRKVGGRSFSAPPKFRRISFRTMR